MITPWTREEDSAAFIGRPKLLLVIEDLFVAALLARLFDGGLSLHIGL